jgi:hypothetical protein
VTLRRFIQEAQRFVVGTGVASFRTMPFTVVLNWTAHLKWKLSD